MVNNDLDRLLRFVESERYAKTCKISDDQKQKIKSGDYALTYLGYDMLQQILFDDQSITVGDSAYEKRIEEHDKIIKMSQQAEHEHILSNDPPYKAENDIKEDELQ